MQGCSALAVAGSPVVPQWWRRHSRLDREGQVTSVSSIPSQQTSEELGFGDRLSPLLRAAILAALFILAVVTTRLLLAGWAVDPDTWFHLATGRWIVENGAIPRTDALSWFGRLHSTRWIVHEWLFEVGIFSAWKLAGFQGVFALTGVFVGLAVLAVRKLAEIRGASWLVSLAVSLVALAGLMRFISPRPGVVSFLLLPLMAILLERDRWALAFVVFVLGMNVHGATYPLYLLVILYYASPKRPLMLLVAAVLVLAQPAGFALLKYPFFTLDPIMEFIQEFQPTVLGTDYLFLGVLLVSLFLLDRDKVKRKDLVAAGVLTFLALRTVRTQAYFFILALPLLAPSVRTQSRQRPASESDDSLLGEREWRPSPRAIGIAILLGLIASSVLLVLQMPQWSIDADKGYPRGALDYVKAQKITRFWNEWNDGGYLMFQGVPPLIDGRADPFATFFNPEVTVGNEYMRSYRGSDDIRPFLRKYDVSYLIVDRANPQYRLFEQSRYFKVLYQDDQAAVFKLEDSAAP